MSHKMKRPEVVKVSDDGREKVLCERCRGCDVYSILRCGEAVRFAKNPRCKLCNGSGFTWRHKRRPLPGFG